MCERTQRKDDRRAHHEGGICKTKREKAWKKTNLPTSCSRTSSLHNSEGEKEKKKKNLFKPPSVWDLVMTALENEDMELCRLLTMGFLYYDED